MLKKNIKLAVLELEDLQNIIVSQQKLIDFENKNKIDGGDI